MPETIYASFADATLCEQAAGALIDYGVRKEDVSLVSHDSYQPGTGQVAAASVGTRSAGDTMGTAALAGRDTSGNNLAFDNDAVPPAQADLVASGHAASNYSDAHAALGNAEYNSEYRDQRSAPMPDTSATNVGRFGDDNTLGDDRAASPAISTAHNEPVIGYGATRAAGTGEHSSATDHEPVSTVAHLTDAPTTASASGMGVPSSATQSYATYDTNPDVEGAAKQGISVTTAADAQAGAAKGATWGLGLGVLAGIAALAVPGVGWIVGGGALATAIAGMIGTTVAGAIAGGVTGYLKDQGVPHEVATHYGTAVEKGGAILAVHAPSGHVDPTTIQNILQKYGAVNVNAY